MRADAIWTFFKKVTKCRLLFLSKSDLRIFEKPGETKILTDGTVAEISFVRRVYRGRSPLCRECKGEAAPCWG